MFKKIVSLINDPILRRWVYGFLIRKWDWKNPNSYRPDYISNLTLDLLETNGSSFYEIKEFKKPEGKTKYNLAGETMNLEPENFQNFSEKDFFDTESRQAFHRFAWLANSGLINEPEWTFLMWESWMEKYFDTSSTYAWHPYTTSERLTNLVMFADRHGFPAKHEKFHEFVLKHVETLYENLEYFGDLHTGNHLANNGKGLYLVGLYLEADSWIEIGLTILREESKRLFTINGTLREGSIHYHLLVTKWYLECWLASVKFNRKEQPEFFEIIRPMLFNAANFNMPAGLPLIGDVSPDCTPEYLACLTSGSETGWIASLKTYDRKLISGLFSKLKKRLKNKKPPFYRIDSSPWSAMVYVNNEGWQPLPGHGHNDFGVFEIHHNDERIFVDLGRRSYDKLGDIDKLADRHNVLCIDNSPAYPENRAYYSNKFKRSIIPKSPNWEVNDRSIKFEAECFPTIPEVKSWIREWNFSTDKVLLQDIVIGSGVHKIVRYLNTPKNCILGKGEIICGSIRIKFSGSAELREIEYWKNYGECERATNIKISCDAQLPFQDTIEITSLA